MIRGLCLWGSGRPGLAEPFDPCDSGALAVDHESFARDVAALGPFERSDDGGLFPGERHVLWRAVPEAGADVLVCGRCGSALDVAWELRSQGSLPEWGSVLALEQTRGRGQLRRHWISPPGNLHAVLAWPAMPGSSGWNGLLPLVAGYLVALACERLWAFVALKWPNDLVWQGKKIGGMLVEERQGRCLVGIGLNLAQAPGEAQLRDGFALPATRFCPGGVDLAPLSAWLALVKQVKKGYAQLVQESDPPRFLSLVSERLAWMGSRVLVREGNVAGFEARITGLSPAGGLVLERDDGREEVLLSGSFVPLREG